MTATLKSGLVDFPTAARDYLEAFYHARQVQFGDIKRKIRLLRECFGLEDTVIAAEGGIEDEATELRAVEFYVLTQQGMI